VYQEFVTLYPQSSVQNEHNLLDSAGNRVIDPETRTGRRLDHVVIHEGRVIDVVETTSLTANKRKQLLHESDVRNNGGVYIRDKETGELLVVPEISRIERRP